MAILLEEKKKMMAVYGCGPKIVERLDSIGITCMDDLKGKTAEELGHSIDFVLEGKTCWGTHSMALASLQNLIEAAERKR